MPRAAVVLAARHPVDTDLEHTRRSSGSNTIPVQVLYRGKQNFIYYRVRPVLEMFIALLLQVLVPVPGTGCSNCGLKLWVTSA